jgi:hypothetical protein
MSQNQLSSYDLAMNEKGDALMVWSGPQGDYNSAFSPDNGWSLPEQFVSKDTGMERLQVVIDPSGNGLAVWASGGNVYSSRYRAGAGWTSPEILGLLGMSESPLSLSMNSQGDAFLVWERWDLSQTGDWIIYASQFKHDVGWTSPVTLYSSDIGHGPEVAADDQGGAVAVWVDNVTFSVYASRFVPDQGWLQEEILKSGILPAEVKVAVDSLGNALAIWHDSYDKRVYADRYLIGQGWNGVEVLREATPEFGDTGPIQLKMDAEGNAIALWWADYVFIINKAGRERRCWEDSKKMASLHMA